MAQTTKDLQTGPFPRCVESTADYCAFVSRHFDTAIVTVYSKVSGVPDFNNPVSSYETLGKGATLSARREIARLEKEMAA